MPKDNLTRFFLLPGLILEKWVRIQSSRFVQLHCQQELKKWPQCPSCSHPKVYLHQHYQRKVKDGPIRGIIPIFILKVRRFRCQKCKKTFSETIPGIKKNARLTERMQKQIFWSCENFSDLKKVQKSTTCGTKTIYKRYYQQLELEQRKRMKNPWPKKIGIDEHAFGKNKQRGHRNFVTMIVDHTNKRPKELLPSRSSSQIQKMLAYIPGRENVQEITMDLSPAYRNFAQEFFPKARITADHFHVVRLLNPALNKARKEITGDKRKHPLRKMLLKSGFRLEVFQRKAIWRWLEEHPNIKAIYIAKEALHTLYRCRGHKKARKSLINLLDWLALQKLPELKRLRDTLMKWKEEILNYFKSRMTNARTEGFNNVAKSIIKTSYGFKNFNNYRLRILNI